MDENRCVKCSSTKTRVRIRTNERVCEHCGAITKIDEPVKAEEPVELEEQRPARVGYYG